MKAWSFLSFVAACGVAALVSPLQAREPARSLDDLVRLEAKVAEVARKAMPATVALVSEKVGSSGSGVITSADGMILTAAHVIQGADDLTVVFPDGKQVKGEVLGANYSKDIAMVRIADPGPWPFVDLGASKPLRAGDWVVAMGHSAGYDPARTPPVRYGRVVSRGPGNFLTTDCTLIGGDSGGPLFDLDGKLVGIHSSIGQSFQNNNHAGIDGFREDWDRMLQGEAWGELTMNPFANPEMPVLGIEMAPRRVAGVLVGGVPPQSPAAAAGIRAGDVIQSLDEVPVRSGQDLLRLLAKYQAGDKLAVGILRDRETLDVEVTLQRQDEIFRRQPGRAAMLRSESDILLLTPQERKEIDDQAVEFNKALSPVLQDAARSAVRVWSGARRLAYGTVVGDGTRVITKWSEVARARDPLQVQGHRGETRPATVTGVYENEDLAVLTVEGEPLVAAAWSTEKIHLGNFLAAPQPDGKAAAFGVVSVLERNLRSSDQSFLGVAGAVGFDGTGVKITEVTPGSGAEAAGLKKGDVIVRIGDRAIAGLLELRSALTASQPGETLEVAALVDGKEKVFKVVLGSKPESATMGFPGDRLQQMERMGGAISRVRDSFSNAVQTDMRLAPDQIGGPVVDLQGRVMGVSVARADRTRSFVMPAATVEKILAGEATDPAVAREKMQEEAQAMVSRRRAARMPDADSPEPDGGGMRGLPPAGPSQERLREHLSSMEKLMELLREELDGIEGQVPMEAR